MSLNQADFDYIRNLMQQRSAIMLDKDKEYLVETRLLALARNGGFDSVADLVSQMRAVPNFELQRKVIEALANNETSFFRDVYPFQNLQHRIIPELMQRRAAVKRLHIWCAACSSGQEPYSIAMLLREHFPALEAWQVQIIGSDLSTEILRRARQGCYGQLDMNRGLPARLLVKYFIQGGVGWQIKDEIRRMVEFRIINLIGPWPALPPLDLILLRNVLIYFDVAAKRRILEKVRQVLRPDGYLLLGGAETTLHLDDAFERVPFERSCGYRLRPC